MNGSRVTTLIFDVDDTLYDVGCGFSDHRNYEGAPNFMVESLGFRDFESAKKIRDEYFERYHSTTKALTVAELEGRFPPLESGQSAKQPRFDPKELDEFFATKLNFQLLGGKKTSLFHDLKACPLQKIIFSNGPRSYVKRILQELGLLEIFDNERIFAVTDVLPACKPEAEAFEKVFRSVGVTAAECVMIEDSMKNVRRAKVLGLGTVLVVGKGRLHLETESSRRYDGPIVDDPAVDVAIETVEELRQAIPSLWECRPDEESAR